MPGGDRTGPWGAGPRTGRAAGFCSGYGMPGFMNRGVVPGFGGRGLFPGGGGGWGRGWRRWLATGLPGRTRSLASALFGQGRAGGAGPAPEGAVADELPTSDVAAMRRRAEYLEEELGALRERIARLQTASSKRT